MISSHNGRREQSGQAKIQHTNLDSDNGKKGMQIGVVAERTGLSLRTIRYYEEEGLVISSDRTAGGFRLYTETDCERLQLIKRMKPLGFSLDEMSDLLRVLDELAADTEEIAKDELVKRLHEFTQSSEERCMQLKRQLKEQLDAAIGFAEMLRHRLEDERSRSND